MSSLSIPGLKQQLRGKATLAQYHFATVFVDHFSSLEYVHLHKKNDGDSILAGKLAFERYANGHFISIHHYHCDNGIFADNAFCTACKAANQTVSFCGVNAHHQSGRAEKRIRDLCDCARSMILLAKHNWPAAITAHLWPFAMVYASLRFHTFGCPVYNLEPDLQSGSPLPNKWCDRSRIGIFLGLSREQASSVSLVLNPDTGLISPQFHVKHDERFEAIDHPAMKNIGKWQGETQIHRLKQKKQLRPRKRRKVTIINPSNETLPPPAEAIASTPPTSEANDGPTAATVGDSPEQGERNQSSVEATTNGDTPAEATPCPVEATTKNDGSERLRAEATANEERMGDQQEVADSPQVEANRVMLKKQKAVPEGEMPKRRKQKAAPEGDTPKRRKRKGASEGDDRKQKEKKKPSSEGDDAASEGDNVAEFNKVTFASPLRLKAHQSISQERKRKREESGIDLFVTTNLLKERRSEIEHAIHTYQTKTAR